MGFYVIISHISQVDFNELNNEVIRGRH